MRIIYFILLLILFNSNFVFSQQISVDDTVGLQPLIENNLVNGCVNITNISSSVNGAPSGLASYAYFERASSAFPFENGIMLSTGGAASGGNSLRTPTLSEGSNTWGTDPDLETALGITNTVNATSIEFDFVSISNQFQFNYLLASEEYFGINPCQFSDGFVFLIREAGTADPYQNIAIVPGTATPVNTNTIHDEIFGVCPAQNDQYFQGYNLGDTNYNGRTTVLTASGVIQPNVTYHIKLIIADQTDGTFDTAVFIEGDSFRILDLGEDITTCASLATLDADLQNPLVSYAWYLDNVLISGAVGPTYTAVQDGTYRVEASVPVDGSSCVEVDEIVVVLNTEEPMDPISDYQLILKIYFLLYLSKWYIEKRHLKDIVIWISQENLKNKEVLFLEMKMSRKVARYTQVLSKYVIFQSKCYDKALTVKKILNQRNINSTLLMGVAILDDKEMKAHAWIKCNEQLIIGGEIAHEYTPVQSFI